MDILVLEAPWEQGAADNNRQSVVPYFKAIEQNGDRVRIFSRVFYEANSLRFALHDGLAGLDDSAIIYIASHGNNGTIGTPDNLANINLANFQNMLAEAINQHDITVRGIIFGCCNICGNANAMNNFGDLDINFCFGYNCVVDWYTSTMIDISLIKCISEHNANAFVANILPEALGIFNSDYIIDNEHDVPISQSFVLYERRNDNWVNPAVPNIW